MPHALQQSSKTNSGYRSSLEQKQHLSYMMPNMLQLRFSRRRNEENWKMQIAHFPQLKKNWHQPKTAVTKKQVQTLLRLWFRALSCADFQSQYSTIFKNNPHHSLAKGGFCCQSAGFKHIYHRKTTCYTRPSTGLVPTPTATATAKLLLLNCYC